MKIAVITWFHYYNYGTSLQVSALCEYIRKSGHLVDVIDYAPRLKGDSIIYHYKTLDYLKHIIQKKIKQKKYSYYIPYDNGDRSALFQEFLANHISLTPKANTLSGLQDLNTFYDVFICGSDQIWAPNIFDPHYFLDFVYDESKMIAYAPSIGLQRIIDSYVEKQMKELISRFQHLSIREEQGAEIIEQLVGKKPIITVDPTFLLTAEEWKNYVGFEIRKIDVPYMVVYMLGKEEKQWQIVYQIASSLNLELKVIPVFEHDLKREGCICSPVGPKEFLELVANASYVCTDSFHGTIFSIIFRKQFSVFERFKERDYINQNSRIFNLLKKTGLQSRLINFHGKHVCYEEIDFETVRKKISTEICISKAFLEDAIVSIEKHTEKVSRHVLEDHTLCCGCGACSYVCNCNAILITLGEKGFWEAIVDENKCVGCGKCKTVCPFETNTSINPISDARLFSYKDKRKTVLQQSSSGGIGFAISEMMVRNGYAVLGCLFDSKTKRAYHSLVTDLDELHKLQGSKYIHSYFADSFQKIMSIDRPIVVIGTPCQVASIKNVFISRNDIVYIDLICHGIPTYYLFDSYINYICNQYSIDKENMNIDFRYKTKGWREKYIKICDLDKKIVFHQKKDLFLRAFEATNCYMESCYNCLWRAGSVADLRIGDYWGSKFIDDTTGVSMVACFTERGENVLQILMDHGIGEIKSQPMKDMLKYQQMDNFTVPLYYDGFIQELKDTTDLCSVIDMYVAPFEHTGCINMDRIKKALRAITKKSIKD
ncbi:MAG: polysaccharide pyruvyl transferase family protein [Blautia sp.]|nr:polysaccharide pyruvyl transferase family protein [Blautia sp.]